MLNKNGILFGLFFFFSLFGYAADSPTTGIPRDRLNQFARELVQKHERSIGYPINQNTDLKEFYEWYLESKLYQVSMNNVGNPRKESPLSVNTHAFENEVISFFAPLYGFSPEENWGIVTYSGTDGNQHGMYFGAKYLMGKTGKQPVVYVSEEAHYSIKKLADVQNLKLRLIKADAMGRMIPAELEKALDPKKPALVVIAAGTTFKGGMDDQEAIDKVLKRKRPVAVFRHVDAALFGGYLPFTQYRDILDRRKVHFDSIAVSGHKFFGFDEPMGILITTKEVMDNLNPFKVAYLNDAVPTITCSRSALGALKFWWKVKKTGLEGFQAQAEQILKNATYLKSKLDEQGYPAFLNPHSNTVFFKRPSAEVIRKYDLAKDVDPRLGGDLAHLLVMQHVTKDILDEFVADIKKDVQKEAPGYFSAGK